MDNSKPAIDVPSSVGDVEPPKKKKRNKSFRKELRKAGIDVGPPPPQGRDPALPPKVKRKRDYRRPNRHRANKAKRLKAAENSQSKDSGEHAPQLREEESDSDNGESEEVSADEDTEDNENDVEKECSQQGEPLEDYAKDSHAEEEHDNGARAEEPSVKEPSVEELHAEEDLTKLVVAQAPEGIVQQGRPQVEDKVEWDPIDPLGLFDELEGPLDWPSEGLWD